MRTLTPLEVGQTGSPYDVPVEWGKVREFALATRARDASYFLDRQAVVPPTFLTTAASWAGPGAGLLASRPMNFARLLHGAQEFVFPEVPPSVGQVLTARQRVAAVDEKSGRRGGRMTVTVVVTEFRVGEVLVAEDRHTTIETERAVEPAPGNAGASPTARPSPPPVGDEALSELRDEPLTLTDIVRYQGASGDMNAIHHDHEFASAAGFPGAFSVGMLQAGILGSYVADRFGAANVRRFGVRFREQAWPGERLVYGGSVAGRRAVDGGTALDLDLWVQKDRTGVLHLSGNATVLVR